MDGLSLLIPPPGSLPEVPEAPGAMEFLPERKGLASVGSGLDVICRLVARQSALFLLHFYSFLPTVSGPYHFPRLWLLGR